MNQIQTDCQKCNKSIPEHHFKIHSFQCNPYIPSPIISSLFMSRVYLQIELNSQLSEHSQLISCNECHQSLNSNEINEHIFSCSEIKIKCLYCNNQVLARESTEHYQLCEKTLTEESQVDKLIEYRQNMNKPGSKRFDLQKQYQVEKLQEKLRIPKQNTKRRNIKEYQVQKYVESRNSRNASECCLCKCDLKPREQIVRESCCHIMHVKCFGLWTEKSNQCPSCSKSGF